MQSAVVEDVDLGSVETVAGAACYLAGFRHLAQRDVRQLAWDRSRQALTGIVRGTTGRSWQAVARFSGGQPNLFLGGRCTCAARYNCQHAVALVLAAAGVELPEAAAPPWEEELSSLLEPRSEDQDAAFPSRDTPIAVELSLADSASLRRGAPGVVPEGRNCN